MAKVAVDVVVAGWKSFQWSARLLNTTVLSVRSRSALRTLDEPVELIIYYLFWNIISRTLYVDVKQSIKIWNRREIFSFQLRSIFFDGPGKWIANHHFWQMPKSFKFYF